MEIKGWVDLVLHISQALQLIGCGFTQPQGCDTPCHSSGRIGVSRGRMIIWEKSYHWE